MLNKSVVVIVVLVLSNVLSGVAGYELHQYRQEAQLKSFLGVNQHTAAEALPANDFFDITDANDKAKKSS